MKTFPFSAALYALKSTFPIILGPETLPLVQPVRKPLL